MWIIRKTLVYLITSSHLSSQSAFGLKKRNLNKTIHRPWPSHYLKITMVMMITIVTQLMDKENLTLSHLHLGTTRLSKVFLPSANILAINTNANTCLVGLCVECLSLFFVWLSLLVWQSSRFKIRSLFILRVGSLRQMTLFLCIIQSYMQSRKWQWKKYHNINKVYKAIYVLLYRARLTCFSSKMRMKLFLGSFYVSHYNNLGLDTSVEINKN